MREPRSAARRVVLKLAAAAAAFAFATFPSTGSAADTSQHKKMPRSYGELLKMDPSECMKLMDKNNKGYVTKEEFMKFHEELFKNMARSDPNKVTQEEFQRQVWTQP